MGCPFWIALGIFTLLAQVGGSAGVAAMVLYAMGLGLMLL